MNGSSMRAVMLLAALIYSESARARGGPAFFGLVILVTTLIYFVAIQLGVSLVAAACEERGRRWKTFFATLLAWLLWCIVLSWGPPLVEMMSAAIRGETWSSYTEPYPGHWAQYVRYIAMNRLIPFPSYLVAGSSAVAIWVFIAIRRILRNRNRHE